MRRSTNRQIVSRRQENQEIPQNEGQRSNYLEAINEVIKITEQRKVNQANAFDVQITSLDQMKEFLTNHDKLETKWLRTGEALGAGAKIYGYRVDHVHNDTYKMMSSLARNQNGEQIIELVQNQDNDDFSEEDGGPIDMRGGKEVKHANTTNRKRQLKFTDTQGLKTLAEQNHIDLREYDQVNMIDPLFKQTTAKYDDIQSGSLMTSTLNINSQLLLQLDS